MGYELVKGFKINKKNLSVTLQSTSSNVYTYDDKRKYEQWTQTFKTEKEMEDWIFGVANEILLGSIVMSSNVAFTDKVELALQSALKTGDYTTRYENWKELNDTPEIRDILMGRKKQKLKKYRIEGIKSGYKFKLLSSPYRTSIKRSRGTIFKSLENAQELLKRADELGWKDYYNLKIVEI